MFTETYTREIQTVPFRNTFAQTDVDKGTQTASPGFHVCTGTDREIQGDPDRYVNSTEHRIQQVGAVSNHTLIKLSRAKGGGGREET